MSTQPSTDDRRPGIFSRLYNGLTNFDFIGRTKLWLIISGVAILIGLVSLFTRGLNLGIDFEGGRAWELPAEDVSVGDARDALRPVGLGEAKIQTLRGTEGDRLRVQAGPDEGDTAEVREVLAELADVDIDQVSITDVGPSWGDQITNKAQRALVVFLVVITLYITLRFEWKMALATLAALVHDVLITVGVYSVFGFEVTPATVIAILTILGYSIYDGIVVFDRVDENAWSVGDREPYGRMVNRSLNEVLMRTLNTSITALIPILSLLVIGSLVLGATTLQEFALALFIGLLSGAYSSIFIASPILALLKEREPRYAAIKQRAAAAGTLPTAPKGPLRPAAKGAATSAAATSAAAARSVGDVDELDPDLDDEDVPAPTGGGASRTTPRPAPRPAGYGGANAPRGRKKGKRR